MDLFDTTSLSTILEEQDISKNLFSFFSFKELVLLQTVSKNFQKIVKKQEYHNLQREIEKWKSQMLQKNQKIQNKGKKNDNYKVINTGQNTIIKMKYFNFPQNFLNQDLWQNIESDSQKIKDSISEDKFIVERNNVFFENKESGDIIFINRSLLDDKLDYSNQKYKEIEDQEEENKYEQLYNANELSSQAYDFTNMQSLLQRQKKIIEGIKSKEQQFEYDDKDCNLEKLKSLKNITLILCCGGYFSLAIYNQKGECYIHKSDHKYVVRKKAGQRQLAKDKNAGSNIKSMGSQIRRDQEIHHQTNVSNILNENFDEINKTDIIFLQAPGVNKLILIQENEPLFKLKHKLRSICLTSKKANYTENERLYKAISKIYYVINDNTNYNANFKNNCENNNNNKELQKNKNKQKKQDKQKKQKQQKKQKNNSSSDNNSSFEEIQ